MFEKIAVAVACIAAIASILIAIMADRRAQAAEGSSNEANKIARDAQRFVQVQAEAAEAERLRSRRASYAADFILWMNHGVTHLVTARTLIASDAKWVDDGRRLSAQAAVLGEPHANAFLVALKDVTESMSKVPEEKRLDTALCVNGLMQLALEQWVNGALHGPPDFDSWIEAATLGSGTCDLSTNGQH